MLGTETRRVAFTSGATESLNLFFRAFLRRGDRVVTTATEHSSVVRPLLALRDDRDLAVEVVPCDTTGQVDPDDVHRALVAAPETRLVVLCHGSNVTGAIQDAASIVELAHGTGARVLLDASQTAGVLDLATGADARRGSAFSPSARTCAWRP
jgi:selenocysteine lyase/cysteine desulfurase